MRAITAIAFFLWESVPVNVYARNVEDDMVLQDMAEFADHGTDSDVYAMDKDAEPTWSQTFNIRRRGDDPHYSLAFDRETKRHQVKVLTADGNGIFPISSVYNKLDSSKAQWKLLKVENATTPGVYQIISVHSNLALTTKENTALVHLVEPNSQDARQQWDFRDVDTDEIVLFDIPKCLPGNGEEYPTAHTQCYAPDAGKSRSRQGSCTGYLECRAYSNQGNCIWAPGECPGGKYFNQAEQVCIPREDADCSAVLLGRKSKMFIGNAKHDRVLHDCQDCYGSSGPFPSTSPVVGAEQKNGKEWDQILVATKRDGSDYYSLAFDRVEDGVFKVLTEEYDYWGPINISSIMFEKVNNMAMYNIRWRIVPTVDSGKFQIVSRTTRKALSMTNDEVEAFPGVKVYALEMKTRNEYNAAQLWSFRLLDSANAHNHWNGDMRQYSKYNSSISLSPSSEEVSKVGSLRTPPPNKCQRSHASSQTQKGFPISNSRCYQEDVLHKTSSPNSCKTYLECELHSCEWREHHCSGSRYWNNAQKKCVQNQQEATCGATIFGGEAKVHIESVHYGKVLDLESSSPDHSTVNGFEEQAQEARNQVLVAKRRGNDEFYSLAFHKRVQGQVKILADNGSGKPVVLTYSPTNSSPSQWKFTPIPGNRNAYQIISTSSNLALQMNRVDGQNEFEVRLVRPDLREEKQHWLIKDAETGGLLPAI